MLWIRTAMILGVCGSICSCGSSSNSDSSTPSSDPAYSADAAAGTLNSKSVNYKTGYVVSGSSSVNGQKYSAGTIYFFTDASTAICPTSRVSLPTPRLQFFLPVATGEHDYGADPAIYKSMPGYWDANVTPNTDKTAKATVARITIDTWTKTQLTGRVYAKGDKLEINGAFTLTNCDGVLPQ